MQHGRRDKNDVFVGNIPFGTTEEQLHQIFSEAGGVVNIRPVSDFETGRPKGFAFVEYEDAATALSAIRNLNGYECNGRLLRVNFSNNSSLGAEQQRGEKAPQQERTVKGVVMQMGAHEVWDVVSNMKQLVEKEPDKAKQMFVSHPQVAEALLHMQVRLGMLKADDVPSLQAPPAPSVVGGAIMLGTGAVLPQLVPVSTQLMQAPNQPHLAPATNPALGWGQQAVQQPLPSQQVAHLPPQSTPQQLQQQQQLPQQQLQQQQLQQQLQQQQLQQQQQMPILQPPQPQSTSSAEVKPRDPRARYNR